MSTTPPIMQSTGRKIPRGGVHGGLQVSAPPKNRKFLIVLQYYNGDKDRVAEQAKLIADLERIRNHEADIMFFGRFDATPMSHDLIQLMRQKFQTIHQLTCRAKDASTFPYAANSMYYDLCMVFGQYAPWKNDYYAFINMEADCVPTRPGWIGELTKEFKHSELDGLAAIGHIHDHPQKHLNGVAVWAIDIWNRVPGAKLSGSSPSVAYDIAQAPNLLPLAKDTPLIVLDYQRPTITAFDLFRPHKNGVAPALYHGVKDRSAIEAVVARHITFSEKKDISRETVFTFFHPVAGFKASDQQEMISLWAEAWKSRGWNPVVLRAWDAQKHPRYATFREAVGKLPTVNQGGYELCCYLRWLALAAMGGGLMTDYDVLPGKFTPAELSKADEFTILAGGPDTQVPAVVYARGDQLQEWLDALEHYVPTAQDKERSQPHVSDQSIVRKMGFAHKRLCIEYGEQIDGLDTKTAPMVHFSHAATEGLNRVRLMREYLTT